jgi:hypothetical protein
VWRCVRSSSGVLELSVFIFAVVVLFLLSYVSKVFMCL